MIVDAMSLCRLIYRARPNLAGKTKTFPIIEQISTVDWDPNIVRNSECPLWRGVRKARVDRIKYTLVTSGHIILVSQGTTGLPKGVTLNHHSMVNNAFLIGQVMNYSEVRCLALSCFNLFVC